MNTANGSGTERESVWSAIEAGADDAVALSAAGAARRERMIGDVGRAAGAKRARRVVARGAGVIALAGAVTVGIWVALPRGAGKGAGLGEVVMTEPGVGEETARGGVERHGEHEALTAAVLRTAPSGTSPAEPGEGAEGRGIRIGVVKDDPGIVARYAAGGAGGRVADIDDVELMRLMEEMGKPTGIVKTNGKVMLTAEMEKKREGEPVSVGREGDGVGRG